MGHLLVHGCLLGVYRSAIHGEHGGTTQFLLKATGYSISKNTRQIKNLKYFTNDYRSIKAFNYDYCFCNRNDV